MTGSNIGKWVMVGGDTDHGNRDQYSEVSGVWWGHQPWERAQKCSIFNVQCSIFKGIHWSIKMRSKVGIYARESKC